MLPEVLVGGDTGQRERHAQALGGLIGELAEGSWVADAE
jgi:hypothetical protein